MTTTLIRREHLVRTEDGHTALLLSTVGRYAPHYQGYFVQKPKIGGVESLVKAGATCFRRSGWWYALPGCKAQRWRDAVISARRRKR